MINSTIKYIDIQHHKDERGDLIAVEENQPLPFHPQRTFYLINVPHGQKRAGHAVDCELFVFALKGNATLVHIDQEKEKKEYPLHSDKGLLIPSYHFIEIMDFTNDAVVVVYASKRFEDTKYYQLDQL
ncbi:sugar 3,4-ketoisomerase [Fulvivirga lutimaris]|uniref:sugar 3,4-ketoisomerase n=1 Tax=Fulvivirga lutimaris TaxID=1819566 RepID=UPI001C880CBE